MPFKNIGFRNGTNCLKTTENPSPSAEISRLANQQYGEIYSADKQCRIIYGDGSYLCRVSMFSIVIACTRIIF